MGGPFIVYDCCKLVGGISCELGRGWGVPLLCMTVVSWWVVFPVSWVGGGGGGSLY